MKFFEILQGFLKQLLIDGKEVLFLLFDFLFKEFKNLRLSDKLFIISGFAALISLALPIFSYKIFGEIWYIRHPYLYLAPFGFFSIIVGSWFDFSHRIIVKLIGYLPFLLILITSVFTSLIIPQTIPVFNYTLGFWLEMISIFFMTIALLLSIIN